MRASGKISVVAPVVAGVIAATLWGLSVSVVMSAPGVVHSEIPSDARGSAAGHTETVVRAPWGVGPAEVGLSPEGETTGPTSFGVDDRERIWVLDQVNSRLLCFDDGSVTVCVSLPVGLFEDVAVERDRICVLSRDGDRKVVVFDGEGRELGQLPVSNDLPPVLHVEIEGDTVLVECPKPDAREFFVIGRLVPLRAENAVSRRGVALGRGDRAVATLNSLRDVSLDVRNGRIARARVRLHSALDIVSILDVSGDAKGGFYVSSLLNRDEARAFGAPLLSVAHYSASGEPLGRALTPYEPYTDALRRIVVTDAGQVYRMDSDEQGMRIVRWDLAPCDERSSR